MTRRRISGLDINGWRDAGARDWDLEDENAQTHRVFVLDGGFGSVAVRADTDGSGAWVGGPQAALAPHGRGRGWGHLGAPERRVSLTDLCDGLASGAEITDASAYGAAVDALARAANDVVLAVPDVPGFAEAAQGRVLGIFKGRERRHRLLWRPVAAFLHAMECGLIPSAAEGQAFRFFIHTGAGFEVQTLRLRRDASLRDHLAPERHENGQLAFRDLGLAALAERVNEAVVRRNPILRAEPAEKSRLGLDLLLGSASAGEKEILRHDNGSWLEIVAPDIEVGTLFPLSAPNDRPADGDEVSGNFLLTPLASRWQTALCDLLGEVVPGLRPLCFDSVARGCLVAGRLIERGMPHYFDKLAPISLAVMDATSARPRFADLIGAEATLPANREFVSRPFGGLKLLGGKRELAFFIMKGANEIRHWRVALDASPPCDVEVELRLRQTPGQSWAKLSLTSPDWEPLQRTPILLDWAKLDPIAETAEEVLEKLRTPPPTVPNRVVESPHLDLWNGTDRFRGLSLAMDKMQAADGYDFAALAELLPRAFRNPVTGLRFWSVGTDGAFPEGLPERYRRFLGEILEICEERIIGCSQSRPLLTNHELRCVTWTFTLCPAAVQDVLVDAVEADFDEREHPLLQSVPGRRIVLVQGAGRSVTGRERLHRVLHVLARQRPTASTLNALAMILSRRREAPGALTNELVQTLAELLSAELHALARKRNFQVRFQHTLSALAGLFRFREIEPYALLAGRDPPARRLKEQIDDLQRQLERDRARVPRFEERMRVLESIKQFIEGHGDPDILVSIENL